MSYSLIYTADPSLATFPAHEKHPAQGGFLVIKPSVDDYKNLINVVMSTDFVPRKGWNGSEIGWFFGGMTVQGLLPYYYNRVTTPGRSMVIDRCLYNSMGDYQCSLRNLTDIKSAHFTFCTKPWHCQKSSSRFSPICEKVRTATLPNYV